MSALSRNELSTMALMYASATSGIIMPIPERKKFAALVMKQAVACRLPEDELEGIRNLVKNPEMEVVSAWQFTEPTPAASEDTHP